MKLANVEDIYPLYPMQQGMLFHSLDEVGTGIYFIQLACRMRGGMEPGAFRRAWEKVVQRHPILRTAFLWEGLKQPVQVVRQTVELPWHEEDWRGIGEAEQERRWLEFLRQDKRRGFDFQQAPLLRLAMIRISEESYYFAWSTHHMLMDGWCSQILTGEVFAYYQAYLEGRELELKRPTPYREYIQWLKKQNETKAEAFWRAELKGFTSPTRLGVEQERKLLPEEDAYAKVIEHFSPELSDRLEEQARTLRVTMNTLVQGAWAVLLSRYSGENDVVFGAAVSGRSADVTGIEGMIGLFINSLAVRVSIDENETVGRFLKRLQAGQVQAREFEYTPLIKVMGWSEVKRGTPLFDTLVVFENYPVDEAMEQQVAETTKIDELHLLDLNNFPITLSAVAAKGVLIKISYSRRIFDESTIKTMLNRLQVILEEMAEDHNRSIGELSLVTPGEAYRLLQEWNSTAVPVKGPSLPALFEEQVESTPDLVAVSHNGQQLTYRELNRRANQLAHHLRELGIEHEGKIGICMQRSTEMLIALLGILKAGGAYLPLDPAYPAERLAYMLEDAQAPVVLIQEQLREKVAAITGFWTQIISLDGDAGEIAAKSDLNPQIVITPENLAYVIYTSGSTGKPKGVMVTHAGIPSLAAAQSTAMGIQAGSRVLQFASLSFDASLSEIAMTLTRGATLVLVDEEERAGAALGERLLSQKITHVTLPPVVLATLEETDGKTIEGMIVAGEACPGELVARWSKDRLLLNAYGPTETTVCATMSSPLSGPQAPIGAPIWNTQVHVLDARMQLSPLGLPGELFVGGESLARGYLNHPEITAEKFVPNPFARDEGERLYRTGDLARWNEEGNLEFLGRKDEQVKIHGYRIELGDVEAALAGLDDVEQAAVVARQDESGNKQLVAYVTGNAEASALKLRAALKERIPDYMIPSAFVVVENFPLTPSGKIDRKSLSEIKVQRQVVQDSYAGPRNSTEEILCCIWEMLLKVERVGVHDNFFELGGDSILSIQVITQARKAGLNLTAKLMFEWQTIAQLAEAANSAAVAGDTGDSEAGEPSSGPVPLTPIQAAFFEWDLANPNHYNQAVMLELKSEVDSTFIEKGITKLLGRHDALRMKYEAAAEGWQQQYAAEVFPDLYQRKNLSALPDAALRAAIEADAEQVQKSLDIQAGRLVRAVEYDLGPHGKRLLLVIHHLAVDVVSWRGLLRDLERGYRQLKNGEDLDFGPRSTSFSKWAESLRHYSFQEDLRQEADYWCSESRKNVKALPQDLDGKIAPHAEAQLVTASLNIEETRELLQAVPQVYHTQINDVLLAALGRACMEWNGGNSVLVDVEGHGREDLLAGVDVSQTVGWFTTIYPVLLEADGEWSPAPALKRTKEHLRGVPNRGFGYGVLRYVSQNEQTRARLAHMPQAELSFNYLGQFDGLFEDSLLFSPAQEKAGRSTAQENRSHHALDVVARVVDGQLQIHYSYDAAVFLEATIRRFADRHVDALRQIIEHCRSEEAGGHTPSDFPLAGLSQQQLDVLAGKAQGIADIYPMSPMQQGLLFHALYEPESRAYFLQIGCQMRGELDPAAFHQAWQEVVARHAILRTGFLWEGLKQPVQVVWDNVELPWHEDDWSGLAATDREQKWSAFLREDRRQGFDFRKAPLMRVALIRAGADRFYFAWSFHHMLMDGWCRQIVTEEVFARYTAICEGKKTAAVCPPRYRDYIAWLQAQNESKAEEFWRTELKGFSAPTLLNGEQAGPDTSGDEEEHVEINHRLGKELTGRLEEFARAEHLTLNTIVQGAWAILLSRYSGEKDVVFGATVSGRPAEVPDIEAMVGLFINVLPVRVQVRSDEPVGAYLKRLQQRQSEARQFEYSPLVNVQTWSEVRGKALFQTLLTFENYPISEAINRQIAAKVSIQEIVNFETNTYPLAVIAVPANGELILSVSYTRRAFRHDFIEALLDHLTVLLDSIACNSARGIRELPMLTGKEREQMLREWNRTAVDVPQACVHELVEEQAERTPENVAVVCGEWQVSYSELNRRANRIAHGLQRLGVKAEVPVVVCLERSPELIAAILGILKAGGAYVPLERKSPAERVQGIVEETGAPVLVSERKLLPQFAGVGEGSNLQVVAIEELESREEAGESNPEPGVGPENTAYILYTSGSTGRPKGVMVEHRSVVNYLAWCREQYPLQEGSGSLLHTSVMFDLTVTSLWTPLISGKQMILAEEGSGSAGDLGRILEQQEKEPLSVLKLTPAHMTMLLSGSPGKLGSGALVVGGEALSGATVRAWQQQQGWTRIFNEYGPTEATVGCCVYEIERGWEGDWAPIGRPMTNLRMYVLDEEMQPVGVGMKGELYIGGAGLARGYLKRGGMTGEKFVPDPFSETGGERLYRTGDLGRWSADGKLEYLGRMDDQVKLRGYRVELGEIEAVLASQAAVAQAAVMLREDRPGDRRLVAYVVPRHETTAAELREELEKLLPDYMLPSAYVFLESIPLTSHGKVDRRALPEPSGEERHTTSDNMMRTPVEELVTQIWEDVLGVHQPGVDDDFFEIGGHSLLATQTAFRVSTEFHLDISLRLIFEEPTIARLSRTIETMMRAGERDNIPSISPAPRSPFMPVSYSQQRLWFLDHLEVGKSSYNIANTLRILGHLDVKMLERTLGEVVRRHESLRTRFTELRGEPYQVIEDRVQVELPVVDLERVAEEEREPRARTLIREGVQQRFDLTRAPLFRVKLLRFNHEDHVLLLTMHHIVCDGWSMGILVEEVSQLYTAYTQGRPSPLPELPLQYADYSIWQRQWMSGEVLQQQLGYWKETLSGLQSLDLPADRPRPPVMTHRGSTIPFGVPPKTTAKLRELARTQSVTLYMVLLGAFKVLLSRHSGQRDIAVGASVAGRRRAETEGLVGFFVNTLVLRTDLSNNPDFAEVLRRIKEVTLGAYAHQDLPFEKLVEALQPERDPSRPPLVQVMFVLQHAPVSELRLGSTRLQSSFNEEGGTAKFDITLEVSENGSELSASIEYNTDIFEPQTIASMIAHYQTLLTSVAEGASGPIHQLSMLTGKEREQMLREWNRTAVDVPQACVHELVEEQAERTPENVAVVCGEWQVSYSELNRRANRIAHGLQRLGVKAEVPVVVCLERSPELIAAILGILKAGGAYVPLERKSPAERVQGIVEETGAPVLVSERKLLPQFAGVGEGSNLQVVAIEELESREEAGESNPEPGVGPENTAYILYTSGSTGRPKGVMVEHRSVVNYLAWCREQYPLQEGSGSLLHTSVMFDLTVTSLWTPLISGKQMILAEEGSGSAGDLGRILEQQEKEPLSVLKLTPAHMTMLLSGSPGKLGSGALVVGGEALSGATVRAWQQQQGWTRIFNEYGPTEATVGCCVYEIERGWEGDWAPIGRPMTNLRMYVLDEEMQPVGVGMKGELYIGGAGLARGYLKRGGMTGEKFVPDPFSETGGERLYRTGDLGRWSADGKLEYLGRMDDQVKLRGYRVELGEIEAVLASQAAVAQAAVMLREDRPGDRRLVAYVVPRQTDAPAMEELFGFNEDRPQQERANGNTHHAEPLLSELREHLRATLPDYMIPAAIVPLDSFPLSSNGKLNKQVLPAPEWSSETYRAPRTAHQKQLCDIFAELLGAERIGLDDDFFEMGGHSLLAMRLRTVIYDRFKIDLPLSTLLRQPTVAALAELAEQEAVPLAATSSSLVVEIQPRGARTPFFWFHATGGHVFAYSDLARDLGTNQPFYGFQSPVPHSSEESAPSFEEMAALYIQEIRRIQPRGPYLLGGWSLGGVVAWEVARQLRQESETIGILALIDSHAPKSGENANAPEESAMALFAQDAAHVLGKDPGSLSAAFTQLTPEEQWELVQEGLTTGGILPAENAHAEMTRLFTIFSSNLRAYRNYAMASRNQRVVLFSQAEAENPDQLAAEWRTWATAGVDVHLVPGDHYSMLHRPNVSAIAAVLSRYLEELRERMAPAIAGGAGV
jgi:amino acid adenylation domain-containing protein/non-ribosomal peptide synthase protein (TIGR01720 family)